MTYKDRLSNFTIETENGDLFVFEYRDLALKREEQHGVYQFQDSIPFVQKTFNGSERHQYEIYLSGEDYDIAAANFWEATKATTPLTLKYPSREKAANAQLLAIEQMNAHATAEGEAGFIIDVLESAILGEAAEDTTRQSYIAEQYKVVQQANSKHYHREIPTTPNALEKAKSAMKAATAAVNKMLTGYDIATDVLADLKSIERTASNLATTLETNAELYAQAFQGFIEIAISSIETASMNKFIDALISEFDVFSQDIDDSSKLMLSISMTGGLILAGTQTTASDYESKIAVFERSQLIFNYYEKVIEIADTLEIDSNLIIELNGLMNLTAARLQAISFQAKQRRIHECLTVSEIYTLVYMLMPCETSDQLENEVENFIKINKLGGKELFEIEAGRRLKYYL